MQMSMFSQEEPPAKVSAWQDFARALLTHGGTSPSPILPSLQGIAPAGWSGKTSPVSCQAARDGTLVPSSERWGNSGTGGPTESWTLSTSEHPAFLGRPHNGGVVCSLSDILETGDLPQRFFLSQKACKGILHRAEKRGKSLPPFLRAALEAVASEQTSTATEG